ncbi:MAG: DNA polymerase III subunit alpha [Bacteroidetes bacterium]|nr:DNA polymerase III subunit alpha [Bacteroidota bacterium]
MRSCFSFRAGGSTPEALAREAARRGCSALALTDRHGVFGAVRHQEACQAYGLKPIFGTALDLALGEGANSLDANSLDASADIRRPTRSTPPEPEPIGELVFLARDAAGYQAINRLATSAHHRSRLSPHILMSDLEAAAPDLAGHAFILTGGRDGALGRLLDDSHPAGRPAMARRLLQRLQDLFGRSCLVELTHQLRPGDGPLLRRLSRLAEATHAPTVATGDVRYATRAAHARYDLMTCIREGSTVYERHPARPVNSQAYLQPEAVLRKLIPDAGAFDRAAAIAGDCTVDLLPGAITPPPSKLTRTPSGDQESADAVLHHLATDALPDRYPGDARQQARTLLQRELAVIRDLDIADFFLVVREVVDEARRRGIRCAGRGSAANSITAYLLGITGVDPIAHNLLFERFLHRGRKGTPDIDIDFDSERRDEIISWIEERFGPEHTAMTATLITYRRRSALRDAAKALGWPEDAIDRATARVPRHGRGTLYDHRAAIEEELGTSPLVDTLLEMASGLLGMPRHLGLHSGGMVLSHAPLSRFTPVQRSAGGVRQVQFDKNDVEKMGLVKLDILGLRMLATISEAEDLARAHGGMPEDLDEIPLDDIPTFNLIRSSKTVGVFQIESQGQLHLLAKHQPEGFRDLITEIALFRPGPIKGGMVNTFVRRRQGREPVRYDHPSLKPILHDTYGVILFQEQVLQVAHAFAGMSLEAADEFRRLMSKFRDPGKMEDMRDQFVAGAIRNGASKATAHRVFDQVAGFVGYGFCRSHAAAFAKTVYQSAYLKAHYPAAFMAAVMQHRPGMYRQATLEAEARDLGVRVLLPEINASEVRFSLEETPRGLAIRKPLTAITQVAPDLAQRIVWARLKRPFDSVEDLFERVPMPRKALEAIARSGALDAFSGDSRRALWQVGVLLRGRSARPQAAEAPSLFAAGPTKASTADAAPRLAAADLPNLPPLPEADRLVWDLATHEAPRRHTMTLWRRRLAQVEVRPIETCYRLGRYRRLQAEPRISVAGIVILRQRPGSAGGVTFVTLEDETGFIQCVVYRPIYERFAEVFRQSALIVQGRVQVEGNWRGLVVEEARALTGLAGGYEGHPSASGGRDRWVRHAQQPEAQSGQ